MTQVPTPCLRADRITTGRLAGLLPRKLAHWRLLGTGFLAALLVTTPAASRGTPSFGGLVVNDDGRSPLAGAQVSINGQKARSNGRGQFKLTADLGKVIDVRIEQDGYYPARHVFSVAELPFSHGRYVIPSVPMVERKPGRVLFVFGGDVMLGRRFESPAFGEAPAVRADHRLEDIKRLLEPISWELTNADYTSVNLETVVSRSPKETPPTKSVVFYSPPELLDALKWAGVDHVSLGNNHIFDYLAGGISDTLAELNRVGLAWSGAGRSEAEAMKPHSVELNGHSYAFHGFVGWKGTATPHQAAEGEKGGAALANEKAISGVLDAVQASGHVAIIQFHDGTEYSDVPTDRVKHNNDHALAHGAALVINHHPHVTQGFAQNNGRLVAHSIGNLLFDQDFYETQMSMVLKVWMDRSKFYRAEIVPIHIRNYQPAPALGSLRSGLLERVARLSAPNGVSVELVAGHGVIWARPTVHASLPEQGLKVRKLESPGGGRDLWFRGDFESVFSGLEPERSWQADNGAMSLQWGGDRAGYALSISPRSSDQPLMVTQKTFLRNYAPGKLALSARAEPGCRSTLTAQVQFRGEKRSGEAIARDGDWMAAGSQMLPPARWSTISIALPRNGDQAKGFRIRLVREAQGICERPLMLDDIRILQSD